LVPKWSIKGTEVDLVVVPKGTLSTIGEELLGYQAGLSQQQQQQHFLSFGIEMDLYRN